MHRVQVIQYISSPDFKVTIVRSIWASTSFPSHGPSYADTFHVRKLLQNLKLIFEEREFSGSIPDRHLLVTTQTLGRGGYGGDQRRSTHDPAT